MAQNVALRELGTLISSATSSDPRFPPSAVIDGDEKTFWLTTGMFPQEIVIAFPKAVKCARIRICTKSVKELQVHRCEKQMPVQFEKLLSTQLEDSHFEMQEHVEELKDVNARFLKIVLARGFDDFCAVRKVEVFGTVLAL